MTLKNQIDSFTSYASNWPEDYSANNLFEFQGHEGDCVEKHANGLVAAAENAGSSSGKGEAKPSSELTEPIEPAQTPQPRPQDPKIEPFSTNMSMEEFSKAIDQQKENAWAAEVKYLQKQREQQQQQILQQQRFQQFEQHQQELQQQIEQQQYLRDQIKQQSFLIMREKMEVPQLDYYGASSCTSSSPGQGSPDIDRYLRLDSPNDFNAKKRRFPTELLKPEPSLREQVQRLEGELARTYGKINSIEIKIEEIIRIVNMLVYSDSLNQVN